ncbi:hypothetical protein AB6V29_03805 [Microbacterium sp. 20-116]|uniref:hypothetical protein n=1 Tax=Microbacterium sp. 20-116 TaxID=3239883 RepID=UPI0034E2CE2A
MADADIYGWAVASLNGDLNQDDWRRLSALIDRVERSIPVLPEAGRDYFNRLAKLGRSAVEFRFNN